MPLPKIRNLQFEIETHSADYPVRLRQHIRRNCQADFLGVLEPTTSVEFFGPLDRNISGLGAFGIFVDHDGRAFEGFGALGAIGNQAAVD
jgi:hypothetical protein